MHKMKYVEDEQRLEETTVCNMHSKTGAMAKSALLADPRPGHSCLRPCGAITKFKLLK